MISFFKQHYPFFLDLKRAVFVPKVICILSFIFILLSGQMLVVGSQSVSSLAFIILFMVFGSQIIFRLIVPLSYTQGFKNSNWTVGKEIVWLFLELLIAIFLCHLLLKSVWHIPQGAYLNQTIKNAIQIFVSIQVLLVPLAIYLKKEMILKEYLSKAMRLNMLLLHHKYEHQAFQNESETLIFASNDKQKDLKIKAEEFICIQVTDNYVEIYYDLNDTPVKTLLRSTLKSLKASMHKAPYLFHCHRSYIINLKKVISVNGNSRGYVILLDGYSKEIPVSRGKIEEFNKVLSALIEHRS